MRRLRAPALLVPFVLAGLGGIAGFAAWRTEAPRPSALPVYIDPDEPQPRALTAEEEAYEVAMWPIHREIIEGSAGTMTLAGITYVAEDRDAAKLGATVTPLRARFHSANFDARQITAPPSLQVVHEQYLLAISLYEQASAEMLKVVEDGSTSHLIEAQRMAQEAAEDVVKAGDILWPGEHKPN